MSSKVVKSNELNSVPIYKSSLELKIFAKIITIVREDPKQNIFSFNIKDLLEDFKGSLENYSYIKKVAKNMMVVEFGDGAKNFNLKAVFIEINSTDQGIIHFEISEKFKPYIVKLSGSFTEYDFENIARLKSSFSIRIYELLKQFKYKGYKKISITELRYQLKIEEHKYKLYGHFKNRVLLVAQKELKAKTDIKFEFKQNKTGRKITDIEFFIYDNHKTQVLIEAKADNKTQNISSDEIQNLFEKLQIDKKFQNDALENYSERILLNNLKYTLKALENGNIKTSTIQYLRSALKNNYAHESTVLNSGEYKKKQQEELIKKQQEFEKIREKEQLQIKKLKDEFDQNKQQKINKYIEENRETISEFFPEFKEKYSFVLKTFLNKEELENNDLFRKALNKQTHILGMFRVLLAEKILEPQDNNFIQFAKSKNIEIVKKVDDYYLKNGETIKALKY